MSHKELFDEIRKYEEKLQEIIHLEIQGRALTKEELDLVSSKTDVQKELDRLRAMAAAAENSVEQTAQVKH